jgi:Entner-Doudoroff aldolase
MHLPAIAAAAGLSVTWDDFAELSAVVPLLARIYPNGPADVNHFHAAGGTALLIGELLDAGLMHGDVRTVAGDGLERYRRQPHLNEHGRLHWQPGAIEPADPTVLRTTREPFAADGGIRVVEGSLGRAVVKTSAVARERWAIRAPARVFESQAEFLAAFEAGELELDHVAVVRFQGPRANGMPELHKLTPALGVLMDRGHQVALLTDGRMSGASGKVPAFIHCTPEAAAGGPLARLRDGDVLCLDAASGSFEVEGVDLDEREPAEPDAEVAVPLARALVRGGLGTLEVTLRTPAALEAIAQIAAEVPDALVGAGTVVRPDQAEAAVEAGAQFLVSPGATPGLLDALQDLGAPFLPGAATASEVIGLLERGLHVAKLFPAEALRGLSLLRAFEGPFPQMRFCPTGGIDLRLAGDYLRLPNVCCVGGSWMAPPATVSAGDWVSIEGLARTAATLATGS